MQWLGLLRYDTELTCAQYFDIAESDGSQSYVDVDDAVAGDPGDSWWNTLTIEVEKGKPVIKVTNRVVGSREEVLGSDAFHEILRHGMPSADWMSEEVARGTKQIIARQVSEDVVSRLTVEGPAAAASAAAAATATATATATTSTPAAGSVPASILASSSFEEQRKRDLNSPGFLPGKEQETETQTKSTSRTRAAEHARKKGQNRGRLRGRGRNRGRGDSKRRRNGKRVAKKAPRGKVAARPPSKSRREAPGGKGAGAASPRSPYLEAHLAQVLRKMVSQVSLVYNKMGGAWPRTVELCKVLMLTEKVLGGEEKEREKDRTEEVKDPGKDKDKDEDKDKSHDKEQDQHDQHHPGMQKEKQKGGTLSSRRPPIAFCIHLGARGSVTFETVISWRYTRAAAAACLAGQKCVKKGGERQTFLERIDKTFASALNGRKVTEEELDRLSRFASRGCSDGFWD